MPKIHRLTIPRYHSNIARVSTQVSSQELIDSNKLLFDEDFYLITHSLHAIIEGLPLVASASKGGLTLALGQVAVTVVALTLGLVQCWPLLRSAARNEHRGNY